MSVSRNVRLLGWFNFLGDFRLYGPLVVIYFAQVTGSYGAATSLLALKMLSSAAFEVPTGVLSDRLGRRGTLTAGAVVMVAAHIGYASASGYGLLLVGAVLEGLARSLFSGNNEALLYDTLLEAGREEEYPRHSGRVTSMFQIALAVSAAAGGLVGAWSLRGAVALSIVPQVLCVLVAWRVREPRVHGALESNVLAHIGSALRGIRRNPVLRRMTLVSALRFGAGESAAQLQPVFVVGVWPLWALGLFRTSCHGAAFVSLRASGRVIGRVGAARTLLFGEVFANVANVVALVKPTGVSPALLASEPLAYGTSTIAQQTLLQREFTDRERATMGSLGSLLGSVLYALIAVGAGLAADHWGIVAALLASQAVGLAALPLVWWVHAHASRPPARP